MKNLTLTTVLCLFYFFAGGQDSLNVITGYNDSIFDRDMFIPLENNYLLNTNHFDVSPRNCTIENGCYCTIENGCYDIEIQRSADITVKAGSKFITVDSCHNVIINSGSELNIKGISNRIYWQNPKGWHWKKIKEIPKPECDF